MYARKRGKKRKGKGRRLGRKKGGKEEEPSKPLSPPAGKKKKNKKNGPILVKSSELKLVSRAWARRVRIEERTQRRGENIHQGGEKMEKKEPRLVASARTHAVLLIQKEKVEGKKEGKKPLSCSAAVGVTATEGKGGGERKKKGKRDIGRRYSSTLRATLRIRVDPPADKN